MRQKKYIHSLNYFLLILILSSGGLLFYLLRGYPNKQFTVAIITSILYFLWGIIHHIYEGDLHIKIVLEYLLIAALAVFILKGAIGV